MIDLILDTVYLNFIILYMVFFHVYVIYQVVVNMMLLFKQQYKHVVLFEKIANKDLTLSRNMPGKYRRGILNIVIDSAGTRFIVTSEYALVDPFVLFRGIVSKSNVYVTENVIFHYLYINIVVILIALWISVLYGYSLIMKSIMLLLLVQHLWVYMINVIGRSRVEKNRPKIMETIKDFLEENNAIKGE